MTKALNDALVAKPLDRFTLSNYLKETYYAVFLGSCVVFC